MKKTKQPTIKQKLAVEKLVENRGNIGKAMISAGYDSTTAKNPKNLTDSKGFEVAMDEYKKELTKLGLTTGKVAEKLSEWIDAKKISTSLTEPDKITPDYQTQLKAGEMLRQDLGFKKDDSQGNLKKRIVAEEFFQE